ncbi:DUF3156 family protein [Pseudomonas sp. 2FG]|uniref:DUF3156 family protein n=1 Tax=Pseudomonas sp. 2FG TaxID=2502191 RepID=UPI002115A765|nr:DUF3156 family protein [Pseudomonas sp. 2FG]
MFRSLSEFFSRQRPPSGYRPGVTLGHLRRDLAPLVFEPLEGGRAHVSTPDGGLGFDVRELPQSQFLMHIVATEFSFHAPGLSPGAAKIDLRHTGTIRRQGIACRLRSGEGVELASLIGRLQGDAELLTALMPLDFRRLQLERGEAGWTVRLEHIGASEVVNRMPSFRRYIRLTAEQRAHLLKAFSELRAILSRY